ncbi:helix-turn-helix transcriptional regulator [Vagococcus fluvialis]|uniref:Helix-turn-helix domain-containing protein n=1 Tax=Vagococcus fluvialis TaxID=2738 RepID=A0A7X6I316_9ENTE|nr:helix-turn-helix domain-containing protein [Vagococcus fluvialis]NKC68051.1 helix-turn-helix domain-containing protein [Vagococcus fluvialis]
MKEQLIIMPEGELKDLVKKIITEVHKNSFEKKESAYPYMNKKETCKYIGRSNNTLDKLIRYESFPVIKKGRTLFFNKNDIDNWMKNI